MAKPREKRHQCLLAVASGATVALALSLGAVAPHASPLSSLAHPVALQSTSGLPSFPDIVDAVKPSVIGVRAHSSASDKPQPGSPTDQPGLFDVPGVTPGPGDPHGGSGPHGGVQGREEVVSQGSGFFISSDGYAVTNSHVVDGTDRVEIKTDDGRSLPAKVVGSDPVTDLALLKVDAGNDFVPVKLAEHSPRVGEWVLAIGNPFGLDGTVTAGIVSSDKRTVGGGMQDDLIQIDAPVNQGNSGGPTFDVEGRVIGVNTMIVSPTGGSIGIAFAVPSDTLKKVVPQLKEHGYVARGWIGVQYQPVTAEMAASLKLERARGVIVGEVQKDGPAAMAGIAMGDVIDTLNGEPVNNTHDLVKVRDLPPGTKLKLSILRNGQRKELTVQLGELKVKQQPRTGQEQKSEQKPARSGLGLRLAPAAGNAPAGRAGVVITGVEPNGSAEERGLEVGDVIVEVGGQAVSTPSEVRDALSKARGEGKQFVLLQLKSNQGTRFVAVPPDPA